jgi:hypothetical protein
LCCGWRQVAFTQPSSNYPWNSNWDGFSSLVEMAHLPYYQQLFAMDFSTFIMVT